MKDANQRPILKGKNLLLRAAKQSDVTARFALGRHDEIVTMFGGDTEKLGPYTLEAAQNWVRFRMEQNCSWVIEAQGQMIGDIRLGNLNLTDGNGRLAVGLLDPAFLGKGLGSEAISLVLDYAFKVLKLHRVDLLVLAFNKRAIAAYEKCGFVQEGRLRETLFLNGVWQDDLIMGLLARDYRGREYV